MLKTILYKRSASVHHLNEALQQTKKEKKEKVEGDIKKKKNCSDPSVQNDVPQRLLFESALPLAQMK